MSAFLEFMDKGALARGIVKIAALVLKTVFPQDAYIRLRQFYKFTFCKKEILMTQNYALEISRQPKKEKITLVFVIWMESMWNSLRSVYEKAAQDSRFEAYIIAQPHTSNREGKINQNPAYDFLAPLYKNVIPACKDGKWFDVRTVHPDYVFYTYPYSSFYHENYTPESVRKVAKVCLIQYGFNIEDNAIFDHMYNFLFSKNVAMHFVCCKTALEHLNRYYKHSKKEYPKIVNLGFPRFDLVKRTVPEENMVKPCVLWTPRWTSPMQRNYDSGSSFLAYHQSFLGFAASHAECSFIVRPHPLMFQNFLAEGLMTQDEIDSFHRECERLGNVSVDESADYLKSVNSADIFITDLSSLIVEFFVTGKPVIFCAKAGKTFNAEAKRMDSVLYHALSWHEVESLLLALFSGHDELKSRRAGVIRDFVPQNGSNENPIAESILDYSGRSQISSGVSLSGRGRSLSRLWSPYSLPAFSRLSITVLLRW